MKIIIIIIIQKNFFTDLGQAYMDNNNHYNIIEKNEIENDITNKNSGNQIKKIIILMLVMEKKKLF